MKETVAIVFAIFIIVLAEDSQLSEEDANFKIESFERVFRQLHKEPTTISNITSRSGEISTDWIEQKLDNFNEGNKRIWKMRYKSNDFYFQPGGPIFIFVGAEWKITDGPLKKGPMYDMAKETNGCMFYTEHRYYGESHPTSDLSLSNLKYLTIQQGLADLANFIKTMKTTRNELSDSKVILISGSLGGSLVTWFRRLYPNLTVGGWASSAPLNFKPEFYEYKEVVAEALKTVGGEECLNRVKQGFIGFEKGIKSKDKTLMFKTLRLCPNFNPSDKNDVNFLFSTLSDIFGAAIQSHKPGNIESYCSTMLAAKSDIKGVAAWMHSRIKTKRCLPFSYKDFIKALKRKEWKSSPVIRQWFYQLCTQLRWFHTTGSINQPFGNYSSLEYFMKFCKDLFGIVMTRDSVQAECDESNRIFGGLKPGVNNIYYTHGYFDPWRPLGIQENEKNIKVLKGYTHCKDLKVLESDKDDMIALRIDVKRKIYRWLGFEAAPPAD